MRQILSECYLTAVSLTVFPRNVPERDVNSQNFKLSFINLQFPSKPAHSCLQPASPNLEEVRPTQQIKK